MSQASSPSFVSLRDISPASSITTFKVQEKYEAGVRLLQSGQVLAAIQQFQEASFFDAEDALPIVALAECYIFLCDLRSAIRCYRRALWSLHRRRQQQPPSQSRSSQQAVAEVVAAASATVTASPSHSDPHARSSATSQVPASVTQLLPPPPRRPATAQFSPPSQFLSNDALLTVANGQTVSPGAVEKEATEEDAEAATENTEGRRLIRASHVSSLAPQVEETSRSVFGEAPAATKAEAEPASPRRASCEAAAPQDQLTASEVRGRLAGVLDALGLALFQVGSVEQALRCTTEALELLATADAQDGFEAESDAVSTDGCSGNPPVAMVFATLPNPYLSEPVIALHRAVFLIALQREEEAEVLLGSHYELFESCRAQSAPLLIQLYCNRQAFRKARLLLESQEEEGLQSAAATAVKPHVSVELQHAVAAESGHAAAATAVPPATTVTPTATASPPSTPPSLTVAKYMFTELYTRYRSAALASDDEDSVTRCLDVYPNDVDLLFRRAQLRIAAGELKRSIKDLFRCVQDTNGEHKAAIEAMTTVLFTIGSTLDGESEMQNAVAYYSESLKWRPDNLLVLLARGDCYTKMESFEDALADYQAILNYAPGHGEAQGRIATLHDLWGRKFFAMDNAAQAEVEFSNAIKTDSTNPEFYYHRALCRLKLHQGQYALRDVLSCQELNPTAPHLRAFIARYMEPVQAGCGTEAEKTRGAAAESDQCRRRRHPPRGRVGGAVRWHGSRTPPPPPIGGWPAQRGTTTTPTTTTATATRRMRSEDDGNAAAVPSSLSVSVTLPPISTRATPLRGAAGGEWVRGFQTTLHRRQGETLSQTK